MTEEMKKRIETGVHNAWFSTFKGLSDIDVIKYKDVGRSSFEDGFQAGAKFILEMPELREFFFRINNLGQAMPPNAISMEIRKSLESLKKAGLCE